jgi:hypothetical protein
MQRCPGRLQIDFEIVAMNRHRPKQSIGSDRRGVVVDLVKRSKSCN